MRRIIALCMAGCLALGAGHATAQAATAELDISAGKMSDYRGLIESALALYRREDYAGACRAYPRLVADDRAAALSAEERRVLLGVAGRAMWNCERLPQAAGYLQRAIGEVANPDDYFSLSLVSYQLKRYDQSLDVFLDYIGRWPELADDQDALHVWRLHQAFADRPAQQVRLLQAMFDARFDDPTADNSQMWFELARLYLDGGRIDDARAAAKRVTAAHPIVRMRIDRRFDAIVDRTGYGFDVPLQAKRAVDALKRKAEARPRDLAVWLQVTYAMLDAAQNEDVVATTTRLLDASDPKRAGSAKAKAYDSLDKRSWFFNNRALALHRLGRTDEAIVDLERAAAHDRKQGMDVGNVLNLGTMLCYAGRHREAIERVAPATDMSDYGKLVQALVYLCAATQRGDRADTAKALAVIRKRADKHPAVLVEGLLWAGRLAEAERLYLRMLDDPAQRPDALVWAQTFRRAAPQPGKRAYDESERTLFARPAVQAAIAKVGRVERFQMHAGYGFE